MSLQILITNFLITLLPCGFDQVTHLLREDAPILYQHEQVNAECDTKNVTCRLQCVNGGVCKKKVTNLRFFLIGDTGGLPVYPYYTYAQNTVAKSLAQLGEKENSQFTVSAGDNVYFTGVKNIYDSRFQKSFEKIYHGKALEKPWYMIGGNHDHFGNISAQIAYTNQGTRWTYPSKYYKISYKFGGKNATSTLDILMIDTIDLCGNTRDVVEAGFFEMLLADVDKNPNNPKDPVAAQIQLDWIQQQLNQSKADYLFVVGHYPVYSACTHGPVDCLIEKIDAMLVKHKVSAYIAGHDHNLQHIVIEHPMNNSKNFMMNYVVTGAGSRSDRSTAHIHDVPTDSLKFHYPQGFNPFSQLGLSNGGFIFADLDANRALLKFYSGKGIEKYSCTIKPRSF